MTTFPVLILEAVRKEKKINVSLYQLGSTVHAFEEIAFSSSDILALGAEITRLLSQANEFSGRVKGLSLELKKTGQLLFDALLTEDIKSRLKSTKVQNLIVALDENLVEVPWELLFDGEQFLSLRFNFGRVIKTQNKNLSVTQRFIQRPMKMLILADPCGDLAMASREAQLLRDVLQGESGQISVSTKQKEIVTDYLKRNLRDYDLVHYAGHAEFRESAPAKGGWRLADGNFTVGDVLKMKGGAAFPLLVFSNACQSAYQKGEGRTAQAEQQIFNLANAFLLSGVKYFIGALGKIPDDIGPTFAQAFYQTLVNGKSAGFALRKARLRVIEERGEDCLSWASYILYGDPSGLLLNDDAGSVPQQHQGERTFLQRLWPRRKRTAAAMIGLIALAVFFLPGPLTGYVAKITAQAQWKKARAFYIKGEYQKSIAVLTRLVSSEKSLHDSSDFFSPLAIMIHSSAILNDYEQAILYGKRLLMFTGQWGQTGSVNQVDMILADIYREYVVFSSVFPRQKDAESSRSKNFSASPESEGRQLSYSRDAVILYQKVLKNYPSSVDKALALRGLAKIHQFKKEWAEAIAQNERTIEVLHESKDLNRSVMEEISDIHLDLAICHIEHEKNFEKAWEQLSKIEKSLIQSSRNNASESKFAVVMKRKFEIFLSKLARLGYLNSEFYKQVQKQYAFLFGE